MTKNAVKEQPQEKQNVKGSKGGNIVVRTVGSVMSGSFLSREQTLRALPFIFFLTFATLLYIANGYYAEDQIRRINKLETEIKELRSEYIVTKSDLMFISGQSGVAERVDTLGMKESVEPPKKIVVTDTTKAVAANNTPAE